jgi:ribosomal protein S3AE
MRFMAEAKTEKAKKLKKKKWYPIAAPKLFQDELLGEILVDEPNLIMNRVLTTNLMNLTNDMKHQNINIKFRVNKIDDNVAYTELISYEMLPSSIKRLVRRDINKLDESFVCETKDNVLVRIKPFLLTKAATKGSKLKLLRKTMISLISKEIKHLSFDEVIEDVITRKLQNNVKAYLKKIYPLKICEIRYFEITTGVKPVPVKASPVAEEKDEPKNQGETEKPSETIKEKTENSEKEQQNL